MSAIAALPGRDYASHRAFKHLTQPTISKHRRLGREAVPPADAAAGAVEADGDGVRAPAASAEQLQRRAADVSGGSG